MQHFKLVISNDASLSGEIITYGCVTQISCLLKWTVIVACHRWCIKLRHICDMAETSLVVRDGNRNRNSTPTFIFSIWGHPKIPHISEPGNEHNRFTITVFEDKMLCTVGHLLREISTSSCMLLDSFYRHFVIIKSYFWCCIIVLLFEFLSLHYISQIIIFWGTHN